MHYVHTPWERWACLCVCLLALVLSVHQLAVPALWWDTGYSIYLAGLTPLDLLRATVTDVHPPLYYLLLQAWLHLVGSSPFGLRMLSVLCGVLVIPWLVVCGRWLGGERVGLLAAVLGAVAPFAFHHAREVRMYSLGIVLTLISTYIFLRLLATTKARAEEEKGRLGGWWTLYVSSLCLGWHTHYTFALVPLVQAAAVLVAWRQGKIRLTAWLVAAAATLAACAPWTLYAGSQLRGLQQDRLGSLHVSLILTPLRPLIAGYNGTGSAFETLAVVSVGLLALGGALVLIVRRRLPAAVYMTTAIAGALLLIAIARHSPDEDLSRVLRLAFPSLPLLLLLAALGIDRLLRAQRWAGLVALGLILASLGRNILATYGQAVDSSEDYRPLIAQVRSLARPGDAALATYVWQDGYFASYAPELELTFYRQAYTPESAASLLEEIFDAHPRLWVINYMRDVHDSGDPLNAWLMREAALAFDAWYGNSHLALFVREGDPPSTWPARALFERQVTLHYAPLETTARPGDVLSLDLGWQTGVVLEHAYTVLVHVGLPDTAPVVQSDAQPVGGFESTDAWQPGQLVVDRHALLIPLDVQPGNYLIYAGLYERLTSSRMELASPAGCDEPGRVCIGCIQIVGD